MMTNNQLTEAIERYLSGQMDKEELARFDELRREDADIDMKIAEHQQFLGILKQYRERVELVDRLNAIHAEIDVHELVEEMTSHPSWVVRMWRQHHSKISVAASIAIFAMLATMFFTGYFGGQPKYRELREEIGRVKQSTAQLNLKTNALQRQINGSPKKHMLPGNYKGSGFALSSDGYIVTNYHVIGSRYDSVYVQTASGDSYRVKVVYTEPQYDVAILKIDDSSFKGLPALPYSFKKSKSDLGERVYTIGYSEGDSPVVDQGYLSSANGYQGDSAAYRVSIPVNPGNSGGPLVNSKGSIIGIVSGKQTQTEGASYAVKTGYLYKALQNVPQDSLSDKVTMSNKNTLSNLNRVQQIKKLQNYVFMVRVY
ncbi:serine protease [Mucilaginibacter yixingensis]|nr:serine protease [Mucilaginibacter yixingensis]